MGYPQVSKYPNLSISNLLVPKNTKVMNSKKNNNHDNYDLTQPSITGKPGWERFRSDRDKQHYFHFNGVGGIPLLFSEGYPAQKDRDNGIQSVIKNAGNRSRYSVFGEHGKFCFKLKAGNNLEIGRSRDFNTAEERDAALEYLLIKAATGSVALDSASKEVQKELERAYDKAAISIPELDEEIEEGMTESSISAALQVETTETALPVVESASTATATESAATETEAGMAATVSTATGTITDLASAEIASAEKDIPDALKYAYRIELYQNTNKERYDGRIENIRTKRKGRFSGLDTAFIGGFIAHDLPEEEKKLATQPALTIAETPVAIVVKEEPTVAEEPALAAEPTAAALPEVKVIQRPKLDQGFVNTITNDKLNVEVLPKGNACNCKSIPANLPFDVGISLKEDSTLPAAPDDQKVAFELFIESVTGGNFSTRWTSEVTLAPGSKAKFPFSQQVPVPGIYRLIVFSKDRATVDGELAGSMLLNVY